MKPQHAPFILLILLTACSRADLKSLPINTTGYSELDAEIGCKSKYSEDKKEAIFASNYKDHWMTWRGEVVLAEAGRVSLNMDKKGIQDLVVEFTDKRDSYNVQIGEQLAVKFTMQSIGGCFLPFSGNNATIHTGSTN